MKTGLLTAHRLFSLILVLASMVILGSCADTRKVTYFNTLGEGNITAAVVNLEPVIQKSDILSITVTSPNAEATKMFNDPNMPIFTNANSAIAGNIAPSAGYLVSQEGSIQFPGIGNIVAAGLTKQKLRDEITNALLQKGLLKDPIVSVRFLNFRVIVMGEVARPNVYTIPNEKVSLLEALSLAGDLTIYAKRSNVLLIREDKGTKITKRLDLNSSEIFSSPYYYLRTNDIIYVEPNNAKVASASRTQQLLPTILSGLSFIAIILTRVIE